MRIIERKEKDITILDLEGRITIGEGDVQLREAIHYLLGRGSKHILLNMARVSYMDSSGVGELIGCFQTAKAEGAEFKLLNLSRKIQDVLHVAQLLSVFEYFDSEDVALASFT